MHLSDKGLHTAKTEHLLVRTLQTLGARHVAVNAGR